MAQLHLQVRYRTQCHKGADAYGHGLVAMPTGASGRKIMDLRGILQFFNIMCVCTCIYIKYICNNMHNHQREMTTNKNKYVILEYSVNDSPHIATVGQGSPCGKSSGVPAENRWATSGRALGAAPKGQACRSPGRPLNGTKASSSPDMSGSHGWPPS